MGDLGGTGEGPTHSPKNQALQKQAGANEAHFHRGLSAKTCCSLFVAHLKLKPGNASNIIVM